MAIAKFKTFLQTTQTKVTSYQKNNLSMESHVRYILYNYLITESTPTLTFFCTCLSFVSLGAVAVESIFITMTYAIILTWIFETWFDLIEKRFVKNKLHLSYLDHSILNRKLFSLFTILLS